MPSYQPLRVIQQHSCRFTGLLVTQNLPAERIFRLFRDAAGLQRQTVGHRAVPIGATQNHRIVRRDSVEVPTRRECLVLPERFDPAATRNPLTRFRLINTLLNFCEKVFEVREAFEIQIHLALADAQKVIVRVSHSRHYSRAVQIHNARVGSLVSPGRRVGADKDNAIALDGDGFGMRGLFTDRIDVAVQQD